MQWTLMPRGAGKTKKLIRRLYREPDKIFITPHEAHAKELRRVNTQVASRIYSVHEFMTSLTLAGKIYPILQENGELGLTTKPSLLIDEVDEVLHCLLQRSVGASFRSIAEVTLTIPRGGLNDTVNPE